MAVKKPIAVIIEGTKFESLSSAARFLNVSSVNVWRAAHTHKKLNGLSVELEDKSASQAKSLTQEYIKNYYHKHKTKSKKCKKECPIYCETLNKTFHSINSAAKFAKVSNYTLSTKTEISGRFIDKAGNVYTRLKPMEHRNKDKVYPNTGEEIQREYPNGKTNKTEVKSIPQIMDDLTPVSVLKNSAMNCIKMGNYKKANTFLEALQIITENK